jgi:hypothetical protein
MRAKVSGGIIRRNGGSNTERQLAKEAVKIGYPLRWGGQFEDLLWGMGGPRGGAEVTPMALSFYFCGYLLSDLPRAQLTAKALRMMYAPAAAYPEGAPAICPKTGAFHFGTALALEMRTLEIAGVPDDVGTIEIGAHATALRSNSASRTRPRRP